MREGVHSVRNRSREGRLTRRVVGRPWPPSNAAHSPRLAPHTQVPHSLLPGSPPPRPLGIAGRKLDVAKGHPALPLGGSPPKTRLEATADGAFHQPGAVATAYHQDAAALLASTRGLLEQPLVPPPAAVGELGEQGADSASYEEAALRFQRDSRQWLAQFDRRAASDAFIMLHGKRLLFTPPLPHSHAPASGLHCPRARSHSFFLQLLPGLASTPHCAHMARKRIPSPTTPTTEVVQLVAHSPFQPDRLALTPAERDGALARLAAAEKLLSREMTQEAAT